MHVYNCTLVHTTPEDVIISLTLCKTQLGVYYTLWTYEGSSFHSLSLLLQIFHKQIMITLMKICTNKNKQEFFGRT